MEVLAKKMLECLPRARAEFYGSGFELPRLYFNAVEKVRNRTVKEFDYQYFLDQILYEKFFLNKKWQSTGRATLKHKERSSYLDFLVNREEGAETELSLDPNFNRFVKPDDVASWKALFKKFKEQKHAEQLKYADQLARSILPSSGSIIKSILSIAEELGYRPKHAVNARSKTIELGDMIDGEERSTIIVSELSEMKKNGDIWIKYTFSNIPGKFFSLNDFVPGAYIYQGFNEDSNMAIFSFFVQVMFISVLCKEFIKNLKV